MCRMRYYLLTVEITRYAPIKMCMWHTAGTWTILNPVISASVAAKKLINLSRGDLYVHRGDICVRRTSVSYPLLLSGFNPRQMKLSPLSSFTLLWPAPPPRPPSHSLPMVHFIIDYNAYTGVTWLNGGQYYMKIQKKRRFGRLVKGFTSVWYDWLAAQV